MDTNLATHERYPVSLKTKSALTQSQYESLYQQSIQDPEGFWADVARKNLLWKKDFIKTLEWDYTEARIQWFLGGKINVSENCIDRHLPHRATQTAILWEGNEPGETRRVTYQELHVLVCKIANALKQREVKKGDRVCIYMPMVPEAVACMLACARIGAVHSVVFAGFSAQALRDRIVDADCAVVLTATVALRGAKQINLKAIVDEACQNLSMVKHVLVYQRTQDTCPLQLGRDEMLADVLAHASADCQPEILDSEDPLFILYTSGSTGKPKGVLHTQAGYLLYASYTHKHVFNYQEGDIYCCAADIGWVTGHSYIVYGPLANGATTMMFESTPLYPNAGRYWDMIQRHKVNIFYTAPTAIRSVAKEGPLEPNNYDLSSLKVIGSVGEPINREAWKWYYETVGKSQCALVDTWWQTETGGILISPLPGTTETKPGSATLPLFGVQPCIVDDAGNEIKETEARGNLCLKFPWPGQMRTVYGDHERFKKTYFSQFPGKYFTGDGAYRDADGYYWITGRVDDVLNVSGHRIGTAEVETALVASGVIAEAAVAGFPHDMKGVGIAAFCVAKNSSTTIEELKPALIASVRKSIGGLAVPDMFLLVPGLPKTRSGKIMRRILRKICEGEFEQIGDTSSLAEPSVVDAIIKIYKLV